MIKLKQGNCLELMPQIPSGSVDMILCDLPYGTTYAEFETVLKSNGKKTTKQSIIDLEALWSEYERILTASGSVVLFAQQPFTSVLTLSNYKWFKYQWVWQKNKCGNFVAARYAPLKYHEDILVFSPCGCNTGTKNPITYNPQGVADKGKTKVRSSSVKEEGVFRYNSLKEGEYESLGTGMPKSIITFSSESGLHPTQKPVALCEYLIKTYTNEGEWVLDNCMGSGTTGVACVNTNRNFIGIEQEEKYFIIAKQRIMDTQDELTGDQK